MRTDQRQPRRAPWASDPVGPRAAARGALALLLALTTAACGSSDDPASTGGSGGQGMGGGPGSGGSGGSGGDTGSGGGGGGGGSSQRGFPVAGPWVSWYGPADGVDLDKVASTFRIINIDVDPDTSNFTDVDIQTLRAGGQNRVISYMNVGACESYRSYYSDAPPGHASCESSGALTTVYSPEYPDEMWANLASPEYRDLIVNHVAARLEARGVDGFFLDNMEVVEHGAGAASGPCDDACSQGGLDLVWELRERFPDRLIVMQNATSDVTRLGTSHGAPYPPLLDGISHEEVYSNGGDAEARDEMLAWIGMDLTVNERPFWVAAEDYVGACDADSKAAADAIYTQAAADGISEYVTDESGSQLAPCFWSDF